MKDTTYKTVILSVVLITIVGLVAVLGTSTIGFDGSTKGGSTTAGPNSENFQTSTSNTDVAANTIKTTQITRSTNAPTETPTYTPTHSPTQSPTPEQGRRYANFLGEMGAGLNNSIRTPLEIRGVTIQENVLYLVHNATSAKVNTTKKFVEWGDIAAAYAGAARDTKAFYNDSDIPSRMVVFETNSSNLLTDRPRKFVVTTKDAKAWNEDEITAREFTERWQDTLEPQEQRDITFARAIDRIRKNTTYYPDKPLDVEGE